MAGSSLDLSKLKEKHSGMKITNDQFNIAI